MQILQQVLALPLGTQFIDLWTIHEISFSAAASLSTRGDNDASFGQSDTRRDAINVLSFSLVPPNNKKGLLTPEKKSIYYYILPLLTKI